MRELLVLCLKKIIDSLILVQKETSDKLFTQMKVVSDKLADHKEVIDSLKHSLDFLYSKFDDMRKENEKIEEDMKAVKSLVW